MAFCKKCGQQINEGVRFCPACGDSIQFSTTESQGSTVQSPQSTTDDFSTKLGKLNETTDSTNDFDKVDIEQNKVMAILSYFGLLVLVPILAAKNSPFTRFHANQGLILCIVMFAWMIADWILTVLFRAILWNGLGSWSLYSLSSTLLNLVYIVFTILAVIGIINALNGKAKELPVIGKYKILK
jgi:Predicted membrane protein